LGGEDQEDHCSKPVQAKSSRESISTNKKKGTGRGGMNLSSQLHGKHKTKITAQVGPSIKQDPISKIIKI
jgi:hypothetical protein